MQKRLSDSLSKEKTDCLKGIFAVFVLLHHLYQNAGIFKSSTILSSILGSMGYLSVAVFFFISGYGMMVSYNSKGIIYAKKLFRKRILPFYFLSLFFATCNVILTDRSFSVLLKLPLNFGGTGHLWYLEVQLILYLFFWLIFKTNLSKELKIIFLSISVLFLICICGYMRLGFWWMRSTGCIILGVLWANSKQEIEKVSRSRRKYLICLIIAFVLFCGMFLATKKFSTNTGLLAGYLTTVFFVVFIVLLVWFIRINNKVTRFLGKISLEIYATQNLFISFFKGAWENGIFPGVNIDNPWLYCLLVVACTIAFSAIIEPLIRRFFGMKIWQSKNNLKSD